MILLLLACGQGETAAEPESLPIAESGPIDDPIGRPEVTADLEADRDAPRHPADGGGRVTLVDAPAELRVGARGRFVLRFEVGPLGIAEKGAVVFQSPPFWGWDPPQLEWPEGPAYTTVSLPDGLTGTPFVADQGTLVIPIEGRALKAGESVQIVYGEGVRGAKVDRFQDRAQSLWVAVDGDGDGIRKLVSDLPTVSVAAGPPRRLHCVVPTTAQPGDDVGMHLSVLDALGNVTEVATEARISGAGLPESAPVAKGVGRTTGKAVTGIHRMRAAVALDGVGLLECVSNPLVVREGAPRIAWMDLQVHTGASDGTGRIEDAYRYGRDVAGLDGMAVTDHDHWGMRFLDEDPETWQRMQDLADQWDSPDFVVVPAYEWTNWTYGHRHVLHFGEDRVLRSALDPAFDTPEELYAALGPRDVAIPHHPGGGAVAVDWSRHPEKDGLVELCSVHGSSESADTPGRIYDPEPRSYVRTALDAGFRFGFLCSTDGHDGHPGLSQFAGPHGGLAAIIEPGVGRDGLFDALKAKRVYGTNGPRILLRFDVDPGHTEATVRVVAESDLAAIELVRSGDVVASVRPEGAIAHHVFPLSEVIAGEYLYVRVVQRDGGAAWSSPVFVGNGR